MAAKSIKQQQINKQITQMSPTTGSLIRMHDSSIERHDFKTRPPYRITGTKLSLKALEKKMIPHAKWISTSLKPGTGAQLIKCRYKGIGNQTIRRYYEQRKIITFKCRDEYVTWFYK